MTIKRILISLLAVTLLFGGAGCKKESTTPQSQPKGQAKDSSWMDIVNQGVLRVCLVDDGLVTNSASSKNPPDFTTAFIQNMADRLGIDLEFIPCSTEEAVEKIKNKEADLAFGLKNTNLECSETVLNVEGKEYCLLYRKGEAEFKSLLEVTLQSMADEELFTQWSIEYLGQDYSVLRSQVDTGLPSEEEAEEYDKRMKENSLERH